MRKEAEQYSSVVAEVITDQKKSKRRIAYPARLLDEQAWAAIYARASQLSTAQMVVDYMDRDEELRYAHMGLYIRCRMTLQRHSALIDRLDRLADAAHGVFGCAVVCLTAVCALPSAIMRVVEARRAGNGRVAHPATVQLESIKKECEDGEVPVPQQEVSPQVATKVNLAK